MKRRIIIMVALAGMASACSSPVRQDAAAENGSAPLAWVQPPHIDGVVRDSGGLVVRGGTAPSARVVLRGQDGSAIAASADAAGRFELRLPPVAGDVQFTPEVQLGQDTAVSPETLVVIQGGAGPVVLIAAGEPTLRLDSQNALDAVDADGSAIIASGHRGEAAPDVKIGGEAVRPLAGKGTWRAMASGGPATTIMVDGRAYAYPGAGGGAGFSVERIEAGWRLSWPVAAGGRQSTWLPDPVR